MNRPLVSMEHSTTAGATTHLSKHSEVEPEIGVTVQALWNVGTDFVLVPFAVISYALGDEAGAHEAIAA